MAILPVIELGRSAAISAARIDIAVAQGGFGSRKAILRLRVARSRAISRPCVPRPRSRADRECDVRSPARSQLRGPVPRLRAERAARRGELGVERENGLAERAGDCHGFLERAVRRLHRRPSSYSSASEINVELDQSPGLTAQLTEAGLVQRYGLVERATGNGEGAECAQAVGRLLGRPRGARQSRARTALSAPPTSPLSQSTRARRDAARAVRVGGPGGRDASVASRMSRATVVSPAELASRAAASKTTGTRYASSGPARAAERGRTARVRGRCDRAFAARPARRSTGAGASAAPTRRRPAGRHVRCQGGGRLSTSKLSARRRRRARLARRSVERWKRVVDIERLGRCETAPTGARSSRPCVLGRSCSIGNVDTMRCQSPSQESYWQEVHRGTAETRARDRDR